MARNFVEVLNRITEVAPKQLVDALNKSAMYWAPEIAWDRLSNYVDRYVKRSSSDENAIAVYAILCDCSEEEMKKRFEQDEV